MHDEPLLLAAGEAVLRVRRTSAGILENLTDMRLTSVSVGSLRRR
jgi:hypothetical protein